MCAREQGSPLMRIHYPQAHIIREEGAVILRVPVLPRPNGRGHGRGEGPGVLPARRRLVISDRELSFAFTLVPLPLVPLPLLLDPTVATFINLPTVAPRDSALRSTDFTSVSQRRNRGS